MQWFLQALDKVVQDEPDALTEFREQLHGNLPSAMFKNMVTECEIAPIARDTCDFLRERIRAEQKKIETLQARLNCLLHGNVPIDGCYSFDHFLARLEERRHKVYGWRIEYIRATERTPNALKASPSLIFNWRSNWRVPAPYVNQIEWLIFTHNRKVEDQT